VVTRKRRKARVSWETVFFIPQKKVIGRASICLQILVNLTCAEIIAPFGQFVGYTVKTSGDYRAPTQ